MGHISHSTIGFCAASPSPAIYLSGYYHYNHTAGLLSQNPRVTHLDPKTFPLHLFFFPGGSNTHQAHIHPILKSSRKPEAVTQRISVPPGPLLRALTSPPHISLALQKNPTERHRRHWGSVSRTYTGIRFIFDFPPIFFRNRKPAANSTQPVWGLLLWNANILHGKNILLECIIS